MQIPKFTLNWLAKKIGNLIKFNKIMEWHLL